MPDAAVREDAVAVVDLDPAHAPAGHEEHLRHAADAEHGTVVVSDAMGENFRPLKTMKP